MLQWIIKELQKLYYCVATVSKQALQPRKSLHKQQPKQIATNKNPKCYSLNHPSKGSRLGEFAILCDKIYQSLPPLLNEADSTKD